jgi:hypothetical protein
MSAISSIGGSGQDLYQFLQSVSANGTASTSSASATAAQPTGTDTADATGATGAQPHHHHHHGGGGGDLFKKIEDAVTSALQSAQSQGANGTASADPNQTIEDAIAQVFKQQQSASATGATSASGGASASDPTSAAPAGVAAPSGQDGQTSDAREAFFSALKSFGVTPQQFHADFLAALQQSHDGQPNIGVALQSFPPGSVVDTTA